MDQVKVERIVTIEEQDCWVAEVVEMDTEKDFTINDTILDAEICRMGMILLKYGDLYAEMHAMLLRKEEEMKYLKARVAGAVRSEAEATATKKPTEGALSERVLSNELIQQGMYALHRARADSLKAEHWWWSAQKKADLLRALAYRQSAELQKSYYI